ncbi:MAG TPA: hypothetical protein VHZ30_01500, partial [Verrucomicrobiae bacterium]|nr:hypothetical protein [Verrucomicrobiae bacterium]
AVISSRTIFLICSSSVIDLTFLPYGIQFDKFPATHMDALVSAPLASCESCAGADCASAFE